MLGTCTPLPSLIDQIKTLGELRVVTRNGPLAYLSRRRRPAGRGRNTNLRARFADELGVRLKITPVRQLCGNLCRARTRDGRIWRRPD